MWPNPEIRLKCHPKQDATSGPKEQAGYPHNISSLASTPTVEPNVPTYTITRFPELVSINNLAWHQL
jgi:hypothetical protein